MNEAPIGFRENPPFKAIFIVKDKNQFDPKEWFNLIESLKNNKLEVTKHFFCAPLEISEEDLCVFDKQYWIEKISKAKLGIPINIQRIDLSHRDDLYKDGDWVISPPFTSRGFGVIRTNSKCLNNDIRYSQKNARVKTSLPPFISKYIPNLLECYTYVAIIHTEMFGDVPLISDPIFFTKANLEEPQNRRVLLSTKRPVYSIGYFTPELFSKMVVPQNCKLDYDFLSIVKDKVYLYAKKVLEYLNTKHGCFYGLKFGINSKNASQPVFLTGLSGIPLDYGIISAVSHWICQNGLFLDNYESKLIALQGAPISIFEGRWTNLGSLNNGIVQNKIHNAEKSVYLGLPLLWKENECPWKSFEEYKTLWNFFTGGFRSPTKPNISPMYEEHDHLCLLYYKPKLKKSRGSRRVYGHFCWRCDLEQFPPNLSLIELMRKIENQSLGTFDHIIENESSLIASLNASTKTDCLKIKLKILEQYTEFRDRLIEVVNSNV